MTQFINNMQRLTKSLDYILNKSENASPELFAIYMQNDARQYSNTRKSFKCDRGSIFQLTNLNGKLTYNVA